MVTKLMGPLAGGEWEIYWNTANLEVAIRDDRGDREDWAVVTVTKRHAQHLRDFARNLERAADYLEGK